MVTAAERAGVRWVRLAYRAAAAYGLLLVLPLYATEWMLRRDGAALLPHPEFLYGFVGVTLCSQLFYWRIGGDPERYRPLMPIAVLAKLSFFLPALALWHFDRIEAVVLACACVDGLIAMVFLRAWSATPAAPTFGRGR